MIEIKDVSFSYHKSKPLYQNLNWYIDSPEEDNRIHFIMSPSGAGKSTLFKLILRLVQPEKGIVNITTNARIAYVPQEPVLFEHLSIYDNASFFKNIASRSLEFDQKSFDTYSKVLGLPEEILYDKKSVLQLSGGQKRKISLLSALSLNPNILLLDEPTTGLDAQVKIDLLDRLKQLAIKSNMLILYITHHFEEAEMIGDMIHYIEQNQTINTINSSKLEDFIKNPNNKSILKMFKFQPV
jgi:ABC-2 type transport system ATP-binding protein